MVCRLFLTRWCTSRMAASLESSNTVPSAQLAHVVDEQEGTGDGTVVEEWQAAQRHRGVTGVTDFPGHRQAGLVGERHRRLVQTGLIEANAFDAGLDSQAVEGADSVRRGVVDTGAGIEHENPVSDTGRLRGDDLVQGIGKGTLDDHAGQPVEDLDVDPFELAGTPAYDEGRLPGQQTHQLALPAYRDGHQPGVFTAPRYGNLPFYHAAELPGSGQQRTVVGPGDLSDRSSG